MNTPSIEIENESFQISEDKTKIMIHDFECIAEEVDREGKLPNDGFSHLSNLLFLFRDFDKFKTRPSAEQLRVLYVAQKKLVGSLNPNDIPYITLTLLVNLGTLLEAEIGRYRIISKLNGR